MSPRHRISRAAIELLKRFEGYRRRAAELPDGRWTIGYGHTLTAREGAEVSESDAEALLLYDLIAVAHAINETTFAPLTQNQFDALCSFAFNIGLDNFRRSSVLRRLNEGAHLQAACGMELWRKAQVDGERIVIDALVRRRAAEKALFLTPPYAAWIPAPSPILRPLLDADARHLVPRETPESVMAELAGERLVLVRREAEPAPAPVAPPEDDHSPVQAAAEAVQARLETLFQEPGEEPEEAASSAADPDGAAAELPPRPLPAFKDMGDDTQAAPRPSTPDIRFDPSPPSDLAPDVTEAPATADVLAAPAEEAAFPFRRPTARSRPTAATGVASLFVLAAIGLAFFAGGLFWGLNATSRGVDGVVTPQLVGLLAGVAGALMFCVAAYLLLGRLAAAAEADDEDAAG